MERCMRARRWKRATNGPRQMSDVSPRSTGAYFGRFAIVWAWKLGAKHACTPTTATHSTQALASIVGGHGKLNLTRLVVEKDERCNR
jgi:hypothetical protein